jgi:integrase
MAKVEPIRDLGRLNDILDALAADDTAIGRRRYLLFASGIWLGRRVGDLLRLKVGDVKDHEALTITEEKTGKSISLAINTRLRKIYRERLADRDPDEWLFQSRQRNPITGQSKPIDKKTAYNDMKAIEKLGRFPPGYRIGTHTMRKTFGYWYYQKWHDAETLRQLFNHSSEAITRTYIGLTDDNLQDAMRRTSTMYDD